jgi:phospholipid/cholesterol/gamma-HCH transport system ATP-binding protein
MIEVRNVFKSFGQKTVLESISSIFESRKINCIIGKSGSGKTVLLKIIVGLELPDMGDILYDGREFTLAKEKDKKQIRQEIGMVFQGGALFDSLTIMQNIIFPLEMFTDLSYKEKVDRAHYCLNRVGLENVDDMYPADLSGGMQKRAAIARAIVNSPKYLFLDEPNSGLDPVTSGKIDWLIKDIVSEMDVTTIINTHDMNSVFDIGDKVVFLSEGKKAWEGKPVEILDAENENLQEFMKPFLSISRKL